MQLGTALNLPNPRINFGGTGRAPGKGNTAIFSFETGVLDSRINFSRTTNATVTNSAGQITYAPHNLLTYSEQFDNAAWTKTTTTVSANAIASPVSTTTGDTLTAGGANSTTLHSYTAIAQPYTFSIYIRRRTGTGTIEITADGSTYVAKTITSDWARYDTTITPTAGTRTPGVRIVTSGDAIDVWGAQLEIGSIATTYNPTTVKNLLGYSELFDNAAWTKSNSFVQTNLLTYSEAFDNAAWVKSNATISANSTVAPNGYQTADTLIANSGLTGGAIQVPTLTAGVTYTYSIYAKYNGETLLRLQCNNGAAYAFADLNTQTGVISPASGTLTNLSSSVFSVGNGWYRGVLTFTSASTGGSNVFANIVAAGDGVKGIYIWGAQLVQGSVAGDYRRTDAAALPVYYPNHNGVVCAEKLVENTANNSHYVSEGTFATSGTIATFSVYAKLGERNWLTMLPLTGGSNASVWFNLSTGVIGTMQSNAISASIISVGNGWYRCSMSWITTLAAQTLAMCATNADNVLNYTGDGTSGIYIFGAQLSDSASLDPYVLNAAAAPTAAAYYGARFDYDPVTLAPKGLLIEEQRSNLLLQSEAFNTTWTLTGCKAFGSGSTVNATISPDGTVSADLITPTAGSAHYVIQTATVASGASYTTTIYAKPAGYTWILLWSNTASLGAYFDVANGVIGTVSSGVTATITKVSNGFYRCSITRTTASTSEVVACFVAQSNGVFSYTSDETSGMYLWGAQLEAGAFATSYIPTAASQVTRAADVATIQGSNFYSWYNQNEGSVYLSSDYLGATSFSLTISDGTVVNRALQYSINNQTTMNYAVIDNNAIQVSVNTTVANILNFNKYAIGYKYNDFAFCSNGGTVSTDASGTLPIVNRLIFGYTTGTAFSCSHVKQLSYFPQRLSDSVLKGLTA